MSEDPRHLDLAGLVGDGAPIDWNSIDGDGQEADPEVVEKLKILESLARFHREAESSSTLPVLGIPKRIGAYRIRRSLGVGGLGVVYEAEQENPRRPVALKVIRAVRAQDPDAVRLFQREAKTLARLHHPAITSIFESGRTEQGEHYIAMELVRGSTLEHWMASREAKPFEDPAELKVRVGVFARICEAVAYAHQRAVIHRDIKPANILVVDGHPADQVPPVKVLDFGIAHAISTTLVTQVGAIQGTLAYMSPEQTQGNPDEVDIRTDIYSLGIILHELLTGSRPYEVKGNSLREKFEVVRTATPKPFGITGGIDANLVSQLERVSRRALAKRPGDRYQSVFELLEDLESNPAPLVKQHSESRLRTMLLVTLIVALVMTVLFVRERLGATP